jgi:hypothetical protein
MMVRAFFIDKFTCPHCGKDLDAATHAVGLDHAPEQGDVSLCFGCAAVLVYADRFTLRLPTKEEEEEIMRDETVRMVHVTILEHLGKLEP